MDFNKWKAGTADEVWKVIISARDACRAEEVLDTLNYILIDGGGKDYLSLKEMSGKDIVDGILEYRGKSYKAVENGIKKNSRTEPVEEVGKS